MIHTEQYLTELRESLRETFADRLVYIGLQGSYLRGEADENSDFDVMLVLEDMTPADLDAYRAVLVQLGHYDISCGFVCGKTELAYWNPMEACHVLHTTRDVYGELEPLMPAYTRDDIRNFVKLSIGSLFHELCHRYIHRTRERNIAALPKTYQPVFFILQNLHYLRTGNFVGTKRELLDALDGEDRNILDTAIKLKRADAYDFDEAYARLFAWCRNKLKEV